MSILHFYILCTLFRLLRDIFFLLNCTGFKTLDIRLKDRSMAGNEANKLGPCPATLHLGSPTALGRILNTEGGAMWDDTLLITLSIQTVPHWVQHLGWSKAPSGRCWHSRVYCISDMTLLAFWRKSLCTTARCITTADLGILWRPALSGMSCQNEAAIYA